MSKIWRHPQLKASKWKGEPYMIRQVKEDGWRATLFKGESDRDTYMFGKSDREDLEFFARFPRLRDDLQLMIRRLPEYSSVDMEICAGQGVRESVITALKDSSLVLRFVAFATPYWDGQDRHWWDISKARERALRAGFQFSKYSLISASEANMPLEEHRKHLVRMAEEQMLEGWILKNKGQCGNWYKVKVEPTIDCVVDGVVPGQGKYENLVGALRLSLYRGKELVEVATASGMTDEQRREMTGLNQGGRLRGRVVEVRFQRVGSGGRLLHPRFVRWRPDKPAKHCVISQLEEGE